MNVRRILRVVRSRFPTLVVWAMMPLALLNCNYVVGCGCTVNFEAVCQCQCCNSRDLSKEACTCESSCSRSKHLASFCCKTTETRSYYALGNSTHPGNQEDLDSHSCTNTIAAVMVPAISSDSQLEEEEIEAATAWLAFLTPSSVPWKKTTHFADLDSGPQPVDCVIVFRRLVI